MPERSERVRMLVLLLICVALNGVAFQALQAVIPKLFEQRLHALLDGDLVLIGVLYTLVFLIAGSWQLCTGSLADKWSPQGVYRLAFAIQVPLFAVASVAGGWPLLLVGMFMVAANVGAQPAENSLLARLTPGHLRSRVFAVKFVVTLLVGSLGIGLVPLVHGLTGDFFWLFVVLGVAAATALAAAVALPGEAKLRASARVKSSA